MSGLIAYFVAVVALWVTLAYLHGRWDGWF